MTHPLMELHERTTKGPWQSVPALGKKRDGYCAQVFAGPEGISILTMEELTDQATADAAFIAAAHSQVPELVRENEPCLSG